MKAVAGIVFVCCCGVILTAAFASAEEVSTGRPIKFSVQLRTDFTDNRDSTVDEDNNIDVYLKPKMHLYLDQERTLWDLFYAPELRHRTDPSNIQNDEEFYHDLGIRIQHEVNPRASVRLNEKLDFTDDPSIDEGGLTIRRDRSYLMNRADAGVGYALSDLSMLDVSAHHMIKRFDEDEVAQESDEDQADVMVEWQRQINRTLSVVAEAGYVVYGFESRLDIERDFDTLLAAAGVTHILAKGLAGGVQVGWQQQSYDDPELGDQDVPYGRIWLTGSTVPSTRLDLEARHAVRDADAYPFSSQEYSQFKADVAWDMTPKLTVFASGIYRLSEYDNDSAPSTAPDDTFPKDTRVGDEDRVIGEAGAVFKINRETSARVLQRYEDLDSDVGVSFTKNTTRLILSREF
jgi:hypothetical protein